MRFFAFNHLGATSLWSGETVSGAGMSRVKNMQLIAVVHYGELTFLNARPGSKALKKDTDTLFFEECR